MTSRREFVGVLAGTAAGLCGCALGKSRPSHSARLTARPGTPSQLLTPGLWTLGLDTTSHDGLLLIPQSIVPGTAAPLVLGLHGAGARASDHVTFFSALAETYGFLLLAPDSYAYTWDAVLDGYGADITFINRALAHVFDRCAVDTARITVEGFSDGASVALGLGIANGDLFTRVVGFSPGFIPGTTTAPHGAPEFFISHGIQDPVLPIDSTSRVIVPALEADGYTVTYVEFTGVHEIPPAIADQAGQWMVQ